MIVARQLTEKHGFVATMSACLLCFACSSNSPSGSDSAGGGGSSGALSAGGPGVGTAGASSGGSSGASATAGASTATSGSGGAPSSGGSAGSGTSGAASGGANAVAGAAGSAGASGGSGGPVVPAPDSGGSLYRFNYNDTILEVDAKTGGRVSKFSLSGADMMVTTASDPTTWGSVFWTSPRTKTWMPEWPPPAAIDNGPYTATISGTHLTLTGAADSSLGVSMAKDYSADSASGWITIKYTVNSSKAQSAAPWEVSRVPRGGIAFFPLGTASSLKAGPLTVTQSGGMVWFDDGPKTATSADGSKLVADGKDGWEAYVFGGNLFLKRFTDQPTSAQAPNGEGEICLYPGATWVEFEVQGPYTAIPASGSLPWTVQWRLVKIPSTVTVAVGSATLVSFVQQQLAIP